MAIPVIIVSGFLGGGKTTFLQRLLPVCEKLNVRPALVINEAGTIDVDGALLADARAEQVSLLGGCICCTLQADLAQTVWQLVDNNAGDMIFIECSGLSVPRDVVNALTAPEMCELVAVTHTICVVDTVRFQRIRSLVELVKLQVGAADVLILNKTDRLAPEGRKQVTELIDELRDPKSLIFWTSYGDLGTDAAVSLLIKSAQMGKLHDEIDEEDCRDAHDFTHELHCHPLPAGFTLVELPLPIAIQRAALEAFLAALPEQLVRAKGFAYLEREGWVTIQRVFEDIDVRPYAHPASQPAPVLICIGPGLDRDALTALAQRYLETAELV